MNIKKITFIGLGVMGYPMAGHLKRNNYEVIIAAAGGAAHLAGVTASAPI